MALCTELSDSFGGRKMLVVLLIVSFWASPPPPRKKQKLGGKFPQNLISSRDGPVKSTETRQG